MDQWPYLAVRRLALAMISQAVKDAGDRRRAAAAIYWLSGPDLQFWADVAGICPDKLVKWVEAGCPFEDGKPVAP